MQLVRLPVRETPLPQESLRSFVRRHAVAMGYESMTRLLSLLESPRHPARLDLLNRGSHLDALAWLLGQNPKQLAAMTVHRFAPQLVLRPRHGAASTSCDSKTILRFFEPAHPRVCPQCLADERPHEHLTWLFRGLPLCLEHGIYLIDRCPGCGIRIPPNTLALNTCRCGFPFSSAAPLVASQHALNCARSIDANLSGAAFRQSELSASAGFAWLDRLRSAMMRSPDWLQQRRIEFELPSFVADESAAWLAAAEVLQQPSEYLPQFLERYQRVAKHRRTSTGVNRAFGFLLRDAQRLERWGYPQPAAALRQYLLSQFTHGHLSTKTTLFRGLEEQEQLRNRTWLTQTAAARQLGVRVPAIARLVDERILQGRVAMAGRHGRTVGLVSRSSLEALERTISTGISLEQAARRLAIDRHRVSEFIAAGLLSGAVYVARSWRIPSAAVDELLARIAQLPLQFALPPDWISLRSATRQFGSSGLNLARIMQGVLAETIPARRDSQRSGVVSLHVPLAKLQELARSCSRERAHTHGWSLCRLAGELFAEQRFKEIVLHKWIRAGLLRASRRARQWVIADAEVHSFREQYCLAPEACRILQISRATLARWESQGQITAAYGKRTHLDAGASLFRRQDLMRLVNRIAV